MASRSVCLLGKTIQEKRSLPVCAVSPEALEKMCMAAIRNTASVSRRRIRAAVMWRSLRRPLTRSHATLQELEGWKWDGYRLSLGGTSHVALTAFLERHPEIRRVNGLTWTMI